MPAVCVALDLTALEQRTDRPLAGALAVRFVEGLIREAPAVTFTLLTRPQTRTALAHLEAANARQLTIAEPRPWESGLMRLRARLWRRLRRSRFADRLGWLNSPTPLRSRRPSVLDRLGVDVVCRPFTCSGLTEPRLPLVIATSDLQHVSHPYLLDVGQRASRAQASGASYPRAARIVCTTPSLRDVACQLEGVRAERVVTVAPGRLLTRPSLSPSPPVVAATLMRHGLTPGQYFLLVGDLEARHNHRVALTALAIFRAQHPDSETRLVCVGGPDTDAARFRTVAEQMGLGRYVDFPGALPREEVSALIQACRAVVEPSLYETIGETVLEAMQLGRPVLSSQVPGVAELTGGAAVTFDPHRPADLAAAFERVEGDPALLDQLAQLGRERLALFDDAHGVAAAYVDVFGEALTACLPSR